MINWEVLYNRFIASRRKLLFEEHQYTEKHHIVPRYLKGSNSEDNLVRLSIRDHTLAHYILWRWYGNLEDKIAYKMKGGQTAEGNLLRIELAQRNSVEINRVRWTTNNPMINPENVLKAQQTKRDKYGNKMVSKQGLEKLKTSYRPGIQNSPEAMQKRITSLQNTKDAMTDQEYVEKYINPWIGEQNAQYGVKRPGELAGNYGKSRGKYFLVDPQGDIIEFKGIVELIKFGVGETVIRSWRNRGIIKGYPNNSRSPWIGYEIQYKPNTKYGSTNKKVKGSKRFIK